MQITFLALAIVSVLASIAAAGDALPLLDSPGPGYRQQAAQGRQHVKEMPELRVAPAASPLEDKAPFAPSRLLLSGPFPLFELQVPKSAKCSPW
jgi:hypothetical protein